MSNAKKKSQKEDMVEHNVKQQEEEQEVPSSSSPPPKELSTKEAYFASLNAWVKNAECAQNAMAMFPWYLMASYPQMFPQNYMNATLGPQQQPQHQPQMPNINLLNAQQHPQQLQAQQMFNGPLGIMSEQAQVESITRMGGYEYVIAPFWKRAVAEAIDIVLLLIAKLVITFAIISIFDWDFGLDVDKGLLSVSMDFMAFSSDLLLLETLTKFFVCICEATWLAMSQGFTPGKQLLGIRVLYVEAVMTLPVAPNQQEQQQQRLPGQFNMPQSRRPLRALIHPAEGPSFTRAFLRAIAKCIIMTLLFPMCFVMIFFKNKRTAYDVLAKTIVVEDNPRPIYRRP